MQAIVEIKHSNKEEFFNLFSQFKEKFGERAAIVGDAAVLTNITIKELTDAFASQGYAEFEIMGINRKKASFLYEDDNEGGYSEGNFYLTWEEGSMKAEFGCGTINDWYAED